MQELNESIQDTIIREIQEEFGLDLEIDKLIGIYSASKWIISLSNGDKIQQVIFFFLLKGKFNESDIILQKSLLRLSIQWKKVRKNQIPKVRKDTINIWSIGINARI
ncbi:MAG: hypothetical protein GX359_00765 [Clostridiales bacterium]|nr:hypothetical protein [Clostridiales bacterium]